MKQFPKILSLALFFAAGAAVVSLFADTASVSANGSSGTTQTPPTGSPPDGTPPGPPPDGTAGGPGMAAAVPNTLAATETVSGSSATIDGKTLTAAAADTSVIYAADGASLTLKNVTLKKTGGDTSSDDASNFYGQNAGLVAAGSSAVTATNLTVETSAEGANAVFSTGADSKIVIDGVTVKTTNNSSRGLDATWGGTIVARNVKIETLGAHCAALATDRGEGTVTVSAATGTTAGEGSPGIYSTGAISASNSTFSATGSEAAVIEGKNSIVLTDTDISGAVRAGVMIYQSFSGDAGIGTGTFTMTRGTLTAKAGPLFYSTNTDAVINLSAVTLKGTSGALFAAAADQWGTTGSNGGRVTLNAKKQALDGTVAVDSVSSLTLNLADSSSWTGAVVASTGAPDSGKPAGGNPGMGGQAPGTPSSGGMGPGGTPPSGGMGPGGTPPSGGMGPGGTPPTGGMGPGVTPPSGTASASTADTESFGTVSLSLDASSTWTVTADCALRGFSDADKTFSNVKSNGHTVTYDAMDTSNASLGGKTYKLPGGGRLTPSK